MAAVPTRACSLAFEQVPGFFVTSVFAVLATGGEQDIGLVVGGFDGEDEPRYRWG